MRMIPTRPPPSGSQGKLVGLRSSEVVLDSSAQGLEAAAFFPMST